MARGTARARTLVADFVARSEQWVRGTEQAERALDDLVDETRRASRIVDDEYDEMGRSAQRYADRAERAGADAGDGLRKGVRGRGREIGSEVGGEFAESFGEAARAGNPAQAIVDTVTSLGPAFGLAGVALAAGAGLVLSFIKGGQERAAEVKQLAGSMFDAFRDGILEASEREDLLVEMLGVENAEQAYSKVGELARAIGVDAATLSEQIINGTLNTEDLEARVAAVDDLVQGRRVAQLGYSPTSIPAQLQRSKDAAEELLGVQDKVTQSGREYRDAMNTAYLIARNNLIPALRDVPPVRVGPAATGYQFAERP